MSSPFIAALIRMAFAGPLLAHATSPVPHPGELDRVPPEGLCVTHGVVSTLSSRLFGVDSPSSRAVARNIGCQSAEVRFRYLGPT